MSNVVDSSGWIEFFAGAPNASFFAAAIEDVGRLIVPSITILEVFKRVMMARGQAQALIAAAHMQQGRVVDLDQLLAVEAARLGIELKLPLADSVVLATARRYGATLWTQDADFENIAGVRFIAKR
jgi:predicted nucleic acid-binding protein